MGMQPILLVTVSVKKIKGAAHQRNILTVSVDEPLFLKIPIAVNGRNGRERVRSSRDHISPWLRELHY